jgi:hypothetical protein
MSDTIQTQYTVSEARALTTNFLNKIQSGQIKEAQDLGSQFIREKLRETGFLSQILPRQAVMDSELDRDENSELPKVVVDKEPDSYAATMPFRSNADNHYFSGPRFPIFFVKIESQHFTKNIFELKTYRMDIRQILKDNSVKDIEAQEDGYFIEAVDQAVIDSPATEIQNLSVSGGTGITPAIVKIALQALIQLRRPIGRLLMTEALYLDSLTFGIDQVGYTLKGDWYKNGTESPKVIWGVPAVTTIKNDIIPDNVFYAFSTPEFLGKFYSLQDPTLYIKEEADMIDFWTYESVGVGLGNIQSIIRVELV